MGKGRIGKWKGESEKEREREKQKVGFLGDCKKKKRLRDCSCRCFLELLEVE